MASKLGIRDLLRHAVPRDQVDGVASEYRSFHEHNQSRPTADSAAMVNNFYDLVTDFYEYGWGQSFHFAARQTNESLKESIRRHEINLAETLGLSPGMNVLDAGCGIGGPMFTIAEHSGASITGLNNNEYQLQRAEQVARARDPRGLCSCMKASFMHVPIADDNYDAVYSIEAFVHSSDIQALFAEMFRVLKPGGQLASYEWCMTPAYDARITEHTEIKRAIELGNGLPSIPTTRQVIRALQAAGFELLAARDLALESPPDTPWYLPLTSSWSRSGFRNTRQGRWLTERLLQMLEAVRIAPHGAVDVSKFLRIGADALERAGSNGIFTPMFLVHARKP
jgi:sterol 24-C-methyltransferase